MNYIAEINNFYGWVMLNPIPPDAQALWHFLMQMNNRCAVNIGGKFYWRVDFKVPNTTVTSILAFSRQQLDRMRNELIQAGRIVYKKGKGSQAGTYRMIPFDANYVTQYVTQLDTQYDTQHDTQVWVLCNIFGTLINNKLNNNSNISGDGGDVREERYRDTLINFANPLIKKYFNRQPTECDLEYIYSAIFEVNRANGTAEFGLSDNKMKLLEYACQKAFMAGNMNWNYIQGIMRNLRNRGLDTVDAAEAFQCEFDQDNGRFLG